MPMFLGMGAISAAGSLFGGLFGGNASQQAAQQYEQALQKGVTSLQGNLQTGEANYQPYLNAGQGATNTLASLMGTPGQGRPHRHPATSSSCSRARTPRRTQRRGKAVCSRDGRSPASTISRRARR